ncbi:MAG: hypothetical protein IJ320_08040 [Phascolarctobacterium sp.]|nr:hypothetical protein [Acidaminococcaceae bacterium]MBQ7884288.1 hypothetical protein [Phascolarctobacterium sp.]
MKKLMLGLLAAMVMSVAIEAPALAHEYNPFKNAYKVESHREAVPGKVQFVYVLVDEKEVPLAGATLEYVDHDGVVESVKADADGKVRLTYSKGMPFVQLRGVRVDGKLLPAIGEDITADADREDIRKGDVDYYVLQKDSSRNVVYVFDAD